MFKKLTYSVTFPSNNLTLKGENTLEPGATAIVGPNWSGKTFGTIELMRYALFGKKALRGPATDYKSLKLDAEVEIAGKVYHIQRYPNKETLKNEEDETLAVNAEAVTAALGQILGFGLEVFDMVCAMRQKDSDRLSSLRPAARRQLIDRVLGLDAQEKVEKACKEKATIHRRTAEALAAQLIEPIEPVAPRPVESVEAITAARVAARQTWEERMRLQAIIDRPIPEPAAPDTVDFDPSHLATARERDRLERELSKIEPAMVTAEDLEAAEAVLEYQGELKRRGPKPEFTAEALSQYRQAWNLREFGNTEVECPQCQHAFCPGDEVEEPPLTLSEIREQERRIDAWVTELPEVTGPQMTASEIRAGYAALADDARGIALEAALQKLPVTLSVGELEQIEKDHLAYDIALTAMKCAESERETAIQCLATLPDVDVGALDEQFIEVTRGHQAWDAYERDLERYNEAKVKVDSEKTLGEDFKTGAEALSSAREAVKSYLAPSLSKIASSLLFEMTAGKLVDINIDDDFNILVDGQEINTLSGAGSTLANLAVRLALGRALVSGVLPIFIGDEIDADMDEANAAATSEAIHNLRGQFKQIILITHKPVENADRTIIYPLTR